MDNIVNSINVEKKLPVEDVIAQLRRAVGRGLDCQSGCWQIESQLCRIEKTPSTSFQPQISGPKLGVYHNNIVSTHVEDPPLPTTHRV